MKLHYKNLKNKYIHYFEDQEKCDFILTDVLFSFKEILPFINNPNNLKILEIGCGTGILLRELSQMFPKKQFVGLDPHESGFHNYEKITKKIIQNDNLLINNSSFDEFNQNQSFDIIFSFNVFEHVQDQENYLDITNKLLSTDGQNLIMCPNYDFPYDAHFIIPILFNKKITYFFFKNKINKKEKISKEIGLWDALNLNGRNKISKFLKKNKFLFEYDISIKDRFFDRLTNDDSNYFKKRQGIMGKIALLGKFLFLDKLLFNLLKLPFPYFKLIINKNQKQ